MNVGFSDSGGHRDFASFDWETLGFLRVSTLRIKYMDVTYDCSDDLLSISRLGGVKSGEGAGRGSTAVATFAAAALAAAALAAAALAALACSAACCGSRTAARAGCRRRTISGARSSSAGTGIGASGGGRSAIGT